MVAVSSGLLSFRIENVIVRLNSQAAAESLAAASAARNTIAPPTDSASSTLNSKKSKVLNNEYGEIWLAWWSIIANVKDMWYLRQLVD